MHSHERGCPPHTRYTQLPRFVTVSRTRGQLLRMLTTVSRADMYPHGGPVCLAAATRARPARSRRLATDARTFP